jgi:glucosamine-6-phosphate deaminase
VADLHLEVVDDAPTLDRVAADVVADALRANPASTVVPATGETPLGLYAELATRRRHGGLNATDVSIVQLDEYLGLAPGDRRSLFGWMHRTVLEPLGVAADRVARLPTGGDVAAACASFDRDLEDACGIDLAILGLGDNGHLGFNEPPCSAAAPTRVVELTARTIEGNARYWGSIGDVPTRAVTLGLAPLLSAAVIVLLVSGERKREIVHRALEGPVGEDVPASFLRHSGADVSVIVDRAAWGAP